MAARSSLWQLADGPGTAVLSSCSHHCDSDPGAVHRPLEELMAAVEMPDYEDDCLYFYPWFLDVLGQK